MYNFKINILLFFCTLSFSSFANKEIFNWKVKSFQIKLLKIRSYCCRRFVPNVTLYTGTTILYSEIYQIIFELKFFTLNYEKHYAKVLRRENNKKKNNNS